MVNIFFFAPVIGYFSNGFRKDFIICHHSTSITKRTKIFSRVKTKRSRITDLPRLYSLDCYYASTSASIIG